METTPLQVDAVPWESAGRSGILPLLPIGKACQRLKRSLLSMPKYYTIFVEIARCGFIQPAINVTLHFVKIQSTHELCFLPNKSAQTSTYYDAHSTH